MNRVIVATMVGLCLFVTRALVPIVRALSQHNIYSRINQKTLGKKYQLSIKTFFVLANAFILTGCLGIKVGDVKFSATEICSREYAEPVLKYFDHYTLGCLPPQRHDQVSKFRFTINRPLLSPEEAVEINQLAPEISITGSQITKANPSKNLAPTFIGKIFELHFEKNQEKPVPPKSGSFTFPPLISTIKDIPTPVLLSTDVYANSELKRKIGVEANIGAVVNTYLKANYPGIPESVENSIKQVVAEYESETDINNLSIGKFQYVSIKEELLDQFLQELQNRCLIEYFDDKGKKISKVCKTKKEDFNKDFKVTEYVNAIQDRLERSRDSESKENYGFIIGASVLNTSGESSTCNTSGFGLGNASGGTITVSSCKALAIRVESILSKVAKQEEEGNQVNGEGGQLAIISKMTPKEKTDLSTQIASAYFNSKSAVLKTLKLESHSSILAIHYIVLRLP